MPPIGQGSKYAISADSCNLIRIFCRVHQMSDILKTIIFEKRPVFSQTVKELYLQISHALIRIPFLCNLSLAILVVLESNKLTLFQRKPSFVLIITAAFYIVTNVT